MPHVQKNDKAERGGSAAKLKKKKISVQRSHTFNASYENKRITEPESSSQEKKSTPTGSPFPEPKYTKAVYLLLEAKKLAKEIEERKEKGELFKNKLRGSGRGQVFRRPGTPNFVGGPNGNLRDVKRKALQDVTRRCDECGRNLSKTSFSEHDGQQYCNVPCYSMLFSSLKSLIRDRVDGDEEHADGLSQDQRKFRNSLIPKLRTYNTYYADKPFQISCKECKGELLLEGTLRVYWGLKIEVHLKANESSSYWRSFHPDEDMEDSKADKKANEKTSIKVLPRPNSAFTRNTDSKRDCSFQAPTISSYQKQANKKEKVVCYKGLQKQIETTSFIPPHGVPTTLRVTNKMTTAGVIGMLFRKFQIINSPSKYSLCTVYESGGIKKISPHTFPLLQRLYLGPCEDVSKIFIMETAEHQDIPHEVAQYCNFAMYELENFLRKFKEEEEREVVKLKERYCEYREDLEKRMNELQRNSKVTRV